MTADVDVAPGGNIYASVRGWTGTYTDWNSAFAAALSGVPGVSVGWTPVFVMGTGGAGSPPVDLSSITAFTGFEIVTPEPSTVALGVVGLACFAWQRNRQKHS